MAGRTLESYVGQVSNEGSGGSQCQMVLLCLLLVCSQYNSGRPFTIARVVSVNKLCWLVTPHQTLPVFQASDSHVVVPFLLVAYGAHFFCGIVVTGKQERILGEFGQHLS